MSAWRRGARLLAGNILVLAVLVEAASLVLFSRTQGGFFYGSHRKELRPSSDERKGADLPIRLHPYFGFIYRPSSTFAAGTMYLRYPEKAQRTNNYGFLFPEDYPRPRRDGEVLVGVFGGSVAAALADSERERGAFAAAYAAAAGPGKHAVLLPFAQPGWKQPQALLAASYFMAVGQELDLAVAFDGLNEVIQPPCENPAGPSGALDIPMPAAYFMNPLLTLFAEDAGARDASFELERARRAQADAAASARHAHTATGWAAAWIRFRMAARDYAAAATRVASRAAQAPDSAPVALARRKRPLDDDAAVREMVALWASSTRLLQGMLASRGVVLLGAVQPSVFWPRDRPLRSQPTPEPRREELAAATRRGMPALVRQAAVLSATGTPVLDLTGAFDAEPVEAVFSDDCCHLTPKGADAVLARLGRAAAELAARSGAAPHHALRIQP